MHRSSFRVIAAIHLAPLPGSPRYAGDLPAVYSRAVEEAMQLRNRRALMGRAREMVFMLGIALTLTGCEATGNYYRSLRTGDAYIFILIAVMVVMFGIFGAVTYTREEILTEGITKVQRHKEAIHGAEDQIRLKRDALYLAQQELLATYDKILTEKQRTAPDIVLRKRKLLELERAILAAENTRNQLVNH